tara:strand:+ start:31 stop:234 length:204 start_codon:yes stop_codon:yes gene_type:complete
MLGFILLLISIHLCNGIFNYTNNTINNIIDFIFLDEVMIIKNMKKIEEPVIIFVMKENENKTFIQLL